MKSPKVGLIRGVVAAIGERIIYLLLWLFGQRRDVDAMPWLQGPMGGDYIGDLPYEEYARKEGLELIRAAETGGLIPDFDKLSGGKFDASDVAPAVRDFYENTAEFRIDVWTKTWFPANVALWLLVTTISRKVNQLNFPMGAMDTAKGMLSEIVLLRRPDKSIPYTGWYRKSAETGLAVYTGFYSTTTIPDSDVPCVKVVFPMPQGNATVLLKPSTDEAGSLHLSSSGGRFGAPGFYRVQSTRRGMRVWRVGSLKENFKVYVDDEGVLRCDHRVRFMGLPVLQLHYRLERTTRVTLSTHVPTGEQILVS